MTPNYCCLACSLAPLLHVYMDFYWFWTLLTMSKDVYRSYISIKNFIKKNSNSYTHNLKRKGDDEIQRVYYTLTNLQNLRSFHFRNVKPRFVGILFCACVQTNTRSNVLR